MNSVQRSIFFSAIERYASVLLFFVSTAILSRLLSPAEFGVYAVVTAMTSVFAASSQEFGGANFLIQKTSLTERNIRSAFTVTFSLSMVIATGLYLLRDVVGAMSGSDGLSAGIAVALLNFAITPFSMTIIAVLRRNMQFGVVATGNFAGNVTMAVVSVGLAAMGYSYLAPIWGMVAGSAVQAVYLMAVFKELGIFRPSLVGAAEIMRFGMYSSGVVVINVFYSSAPQLFLARALDFAAAGLYSRAFNVTQIFDKVVTQAISPVIMPAIFAQTSAGANLKHIYLHAISLLTALHWPFLTFMALMAKPIILIWLGSAWLEVVPLIQFLCVGYLALFAACLTYPVLVAAGGVRDALVSSLISLPPSLLMIFIASYLGMEAVAASSLLTLPFQAAVAIYFISRHLDMSFMDIVRATQKSGLVTLCSGAATALCAGLVEYELIRPIVGILIACMAAAATWLAVILAVRHPLLPELEAPVSRLLSATRRFAGIAPFATARANRDVR